MLDYNEHWYVCNLLKIPISYTLKGVHLMFNRKHHLYLNETEYSILIESLIQLKNKLIQQGRFTDCVDELLMKAISAPVKRI